MLQKITFELLIDENSCQIKCEENNYLSPYIDYVSEDIEEAHKKYYEENKISINKEKSQISQK